MSFSTIVGDLIKDMGYRVSDNNPEVYREFSSNNLDSDRRVFGCNPSFPGTDNWGSVSTLEA